MINRLSDDLQTHHCRNTIKRSNHKCKSSLKGQLFKSNQIKVWKTPEETPLWKIFINMSEWCPIMQNAFKTFFLLNEEKHLSLREYFSLFFKLKWNLLLFFTTFNNSFKHFPVAWELYVKKMQFSLVSDLINEKPLMWWIPLRHTVGWSESVSMIIIKEDVRHRMLSSSEASGMKWVHPYGSLKYVQYSYRKRETFYKSLGICHSNEQTALEC